MQLGNIVIGNFEHYVPDPMHVRF